MSDLLTAADLEAAKKHDTFHSEVITGKAGAVASGADIDTATNAVTGQVQTTLPKVLRDVGFRPASFNFVTGGTLGIADADKCIYNPSPVGDNNWYSWGGNLPHDVDAGTDPTASGSGYVPRTDVVLRTQLSGNDGHKLIGACPDIATLRTIEPEFDGQRIPVIGYYSDTPLLGGGDFIHVVSDSSDDDGVLTIVTSGGKRWKRRNPNRLGKLSALDAGARADSAADLNAGAGLSTGTDNTPAQIRADKAASLLGCRVHWPNGKYRFANALERRVIHEGNYTYSDGGTTFIFDNETPTTWLSQVPGRTDGRSKDISGIFFYSAQVRTHRLFDGGFYRGEINHIRVSRFNIGFDVSGVYVWFKNCYFDTCNKGVYPRALHDVGLASTMLGFEDCVFFQNTDVGFLHENRPFGVDAAAKDLLSVHFVRCGFEGNARGLVMTQRCWYVGLVNCWSEANTTIGVNITDSFSDVYELGCRWDDVTPPVFPQHRYFSLSGGVVKSRNTRTTNLRAVDNIIENKYSSVTVKSDGTILGSTGVPCTAVVQGDNSLKLTFSVEIFTPLITVTPCNRGAMLTYSMSFDNTNDITAVVNSDRINTVYIKCYDAAAPGTIVKPMWWNVHVGWPSGANTA